MFDPFFSFSGLGNDEIVGWDQHGWISVMPVFVASSGVGYDGGQGGDRDGTGTVSRSIIPGIQKNLL